MLLIIKIFTILYKYTKYKNTHTKKQNVPSHTYKNNRVKYIRYFTIRGGK